MPERLEARGHEHHAGDEGVDEDSERKDEADRLDDDVRAEDEASEDTQHDQCCRGDGVGTVAHPAPDCPRGIPVAYLVEATALAESAFVAEIGLPPDHAMSKIAGAAVGAAIREFLAISIAGNRGDESHRDVIRSYGPCWLPQGATELPET